MGGSTNILAPYSAPLNPLGLSVPLQLAESKEKHWTSKTSTEGGTPKAQSMS